MNIGYFIKAILLISWPAALFAAPITYHLSDEGGGRQIRFISKAPVEVIDGKAQGVGGYVHFDRTQADLALEASVYVEVNQMQTGIPLRDTHLKSSEWLHARAHPTIRFETVGPPMAVKNKRKNKWFVKVKGKITIKGQSQVIEVPLNIEEKKNKLKVKGQFRVRLKDFGVQGPTALEMIGARVAEEVDILIKLVGKSKVLSR